jgi:hypothetical protein
MRHGQQRIYDQIGINPFYFNALPSNSPAMCLAHMCPARDAWLDCFTWGGPQSEEKVRRTTGQKSGGDGLGSAFLLVLRLWAEVLNGRPADILLDLDGQCAHRALGQVTGAGPGILSGHAADPLKDKHGVLLSVVAEKPPRSGIGLPVSVVLRHFLLTMLTICLFSCSINRNELISQIRKIERL